MEQVTEALKTEIKSDEHKDKKEFRHKGKRYGKRYHNNHSNRNYNNSSKPKVDNYDHSHLDKGPKNKGQTLNLEILETARIEQHGLFPIAGKPLPKRDVHIDNYPEVKAIANSALTNMANAFANVDVNLLTRESDVIDYINIQWTLPTYCQLPTPAWNMDNNGTEWVFEGYNHNYNTFSTRKAVDIAETVQLMINAMNTNTAFAGMEALTYQMLPANESTLANGVYNYVLYDQNPFWTSYRHLGIVGFMDGVNTAMLQAVTEFRLVKRDYILIDYFIKKHPQFSTALTTLKGLFKVKRFTAILDAIADQLSYIYCDVEWVDEKSKFLCQVSRTDDSIYSPVIIPTILIMNPLYQMVNANGQGIAYTLALNNRVIDGRQNPYYQNGDNQGYEMNLSTSVVQLIENIQQAIFNGGNPGEVAIGNIAMEQVNEWFAEYQARLQNLLVNIQSLKLRIAPYTSFMIQAKAGGLISYSKHLWDWDIDCDIKYVPEIAIPLKHPEVRMTSSPTMSGQYSASIMLEGDHVEGALVDSTRWMAIAPEWFFIIHHNNFNADLPNYVLTLQFDNFVANDEYLPDETPEPVNAAVAANNVLASVYQLPDIAMYDWCTVNFVNGTEARFMVRGNYGSTLYAMLRSQTGNNVYNQLTIRGAWTLSDGSYYAENDANEFTVGYYYTPYGIPENDDAALFYSYWTTGFKALIDIFGIVSFTSNATINAQEGTQCISAFSIAQNYTVAIPVTMRTTFSEMRKYTLDHLKMVQPLESSSVTQVAQVPIH